MIGSQDFWRELPIFIAFPAQVAFLLIYALPILGAGMWWKDFVGRALFIKSAALAFVLTISVARNILEIIEHPNIQFGSPFDQAPIEILITIGFWMVAFAIVYQLIAIVKLRFGQH